MTITKEMTMGEIVENEPRVVQILTAIGMHCIGCPSSIGESLEEACMVHGLDADAVMNYINEYMKAVDQQEAE